MDWTKFEPLAGYAIYAIVYSIGFCLMFSPPIWWLEYAPRANIPNAVVWTAGIAYFGFLSGVFRYARKSAPPHTQD